VRYHAPVDQRIRSLRYERRGREFKSLRAHQILSGYLSGLEGLFPKQDVMGSSPTPLTKCAGLTQSGQSACPTNRKFQGSNP
jgi:hypothetical protein